METSGLLRAKRGAGLLALLLCLPGGAAVGRAQGEGSLIQGTSWSGLGTMKAKLEGQGTLAGPADFVLDFGPIASLGLGPGEFQILVDDGTDTISFEGTYEEVAPGRARLLPSVASYAGAWCDLFLAGGAEECEIEVLKMKMRAKAKQTSNGEILRFGFSSRSVVTITLLGETTTAGLKVSIQGAAYRY
jgi:hypothetical protein